MSRRSSQKTKKSKKKEQKVATLPVEPQTELQITFSFKYYDTSGEFCLSDFTSDHVKESLVKLKDINCKTFKEMLNDRRVYHFHEVDWSKTIKNGFPNSELDDKAFQFGLPGVNNQKARVFGAYYGNTFFVVWFDYEHKVWPSLLRNT